LFLLISMMWGEVQDVESVAHQVLGCRYVDDVGVVVDALEYLERPIASWLELGVAFLREPFFP
jgi:hypothetical protein